MINISRDIMVLCIQAMPLTVTDDHSRLLAAKRNTSGSLQGSVTSPQHSSGCANVVCSYSEKSIAKIPFNNN